MKTYNILASVVLLLFINISFSQTLVNSFQKISATEGLFTGTLSDSDFFGRASMCIGDLDGDGVNDVAIGDSGDDVGGLNKGAVYVLFMDTNTNPQTISGVITYDNSVSTPLPNVKVYLLDSTNQIIDSTISSINGEYAFLNVPPGTYTINSSSSELWGGGNSADALAIMMHFVGITPLYGLRWLAGDCDASTYLNTTDALLVAQRFVFMIYSFPAGDWVFEQPTIIIYGIAPVSYYKGIGIRYVMMVLGRMQELG